jgi:hypothetical protein
MTTITAEDAIKAASSVARDVADGKLDPADLQCQVVAELTELVGTVAGPDDPLWDLQVGIARQVLAAGGIDHLELAEWAAVGRRRENPDAADAVHTVPPTGVMAPTDGPDVSTEADSAAPEPHSPENDAAPADADLELVDMATDPMPPEPKAAESTGCGCRATTPGDRRIVARGRGLPDTGFLG